MKLHETRLQRDLTAIQTDLSDLAAGVRQAVDEAVRGLLANDSDRMYNVILDDHPYNRASRAIDRDCHRFVARHIPAAGHLRFVSSVLRLSLTLERIGDYAVSICRVGVHLDDELTDDIKDDIRRLADQSSRMLELATRAFLTEDADLARETKKMAKAVDRTHDRVFDHLVTSDDPRPVMDLLRIQTIYDKLERVSDQAKNICEEAVFVITGETKEPKVYKILFIDENDALLAPLAEALARRSHPNSGAYTSQGVEVADAYDPALTALAEKLELDLGGSMPVRLTELEPYPAEYHVVVALNLPRSAVPEMPFNTALQRWTVEVPADPTESKADLVRDLSGKITELMEKLRGADAS